MTEEDKKFCVAHEWIGYDAQYRIITHQTDADLSHLERCNKDSMGAPHSIRATANATGSTPASPIGGKA